MTMGLRRLMLGIGAALLIGGWATMRYDETWVNDDGVFLCVIVSMTVGAGLIGFAVLRPTNRKDE